MITLCRRAFEIVELAAFCGPQHDPGDDADNNEAQRMSRMRMSMGLAGRGERGGARGAVVIGLVGSLTGAARSTHQQRADRHADASQPGRDIPQRGSRDGDEIVAERPASSGE